jgi:dienelactone hydrolase
MLSADWGAKVANASKVFKPAGPGPFPVALILHGCGGKTPFLETYAQVAVEAGWAAVVVDSFKPRGMSMLDGKLFVCTGTRCRGSSARATSSPCWPGWRASLGPTPSACSWPAGAMAAGRSWTATRSA